MKVWDEELGQPVAIKVLEVPPNPKSRYLKSIRNETLIMNNFNHENIMGLRRVVESSHHIFLVMNLMVDDLRNIFNRSGCMFDEEFAGKLFV